MIKLNITEYNNEIISYLCLILYVQPQSTYVLKRNKYIEYFVLFLISKTATMPLIFFTAAKTWHKPPQYKISYTIFVNCVHIISLNERAYPHE